MVSTPQIVGEETTVPCSTPQEAARLCLPLELLAQILEGKGTPDAKEEAQSLRHKVEEMRTRHEALIKVRASQAGRLTVFKMKMLCKGGSPQALEVSYVGFVNTTWTPHPSGLPSCMHFDWRHLFVTGGPA